MKEVGSVGFGCDDLPEIFVRSDKWEVGLHIETGGMSLQIDLAPDEAEALARFIKDAAQQAREAEEGVK